MIAARGCTRSPSTASATTASALSAHAPKGASGAITLTLAGAATMPNGTPTSMVSTIGSGSAAATGFLEHRDHVDFGQAQPAAASVSERVEHADVDQRLPRPGQPARCRLARGSQRSAIAVRRERVAHRVAEGELVVGEGEAHDACLYFRGRPSTRSAITLRWISFVPA